VSPSGWKILKPSSFLLHVHDNSGNWMSWSTFNLGLRGFIVMVHVWITSSWCERSNSDWLLSDSHNTIRQCQTN